MKKVFILVLSLTMLFLGCEKENAENITGNFNVSEKDWDDPEKPIVCCYDYETQIKADGNKYCCEQGSGCAPCAVIGEPSGPKSNDHLAMVNDLLGENSAEVAAFFVTKSNFEDIFPLLNGTEIHKKLCTGNYIMSDIIHAYHSNNCVFVFTNINDNTLIAVPYVEE